MNNTHKLIIAVVVILLIVLGLYLYSRNAEAPADGDAPGNGGESTGDTRSLRQLVALGTPQKCTFSSDYDGGRSEGTVYIANGMMRGDYTSKVDSSGTDISSHMILDGSQ